MIHSPKFRLATMAVDSYLGMPYNVVTNGREDFV